MECWGLECGGGGGGGVDGWMRLRKWRIVEDALRIGNFNVMIMRLRTEEGM